MTGSSAQEKWHQARLISASGIRGADEQEVRATAALLSVMAAVPDYGRALLSRMGAPAGRLSSFTEVELKTPAGTKIRPDGALVVERGSTRWVALVEVKTGTNELRREQVEVYLDAAREQGFDCVVTISNQIAGNASGLPVDVDRRKVRRVSLTHLSWLEVLTEAAFQHEHRGVSDPDQAYMLGELIHYLEDHRSGAMAFEDMGAHWVSVRDGARNGTLRASDASVQDVAARWDQLLQYLSLDLGRSLGAPVREVLSRREKQDPSIRRGYLVNELTRAGRLDGVLRIPGAVGDVTLAASLRAKLVSASVNLGAPDSARASTRIRWLLRQLADAPPDLRIEVSFHGTRQTVAALLRDAREDESLLLLPERGGEPRAFTLTLTLPMGDRRDNRRGSFISSMWALLEVFYSSVVQSLRPWQPAVPKFRSQEPVATVLTTGGERGEADGGLNRSLDSEGDGSDGTAVEDTAGIGGAKHAGEGSDPEPSHPLI
ncbi:MAG: hypothetical protein M0R73_09180 [Dehalococcoidia bacterium]|nr:hypothetical protein [Dehalococcoidia bacterium]